MTNGAGQAGNRLSRLFPGCGSVRDTFFFERLLKNRGFTCIAGTDEVGRGPLAGPVVAAAVILPEQCDTRSLRDSKLTTATERYRIRDLLLQSGAAIGIGCIDAATIDRINVLQASLQAMVMSIGELSKQGKHPDFILIDGNKPLPLQTPQEPLIKGDQRSASIAAASIIAKIFRDELMISMHECYPAYGFASHKGYPTKEHRLAIQRYGPAPVHRLSFRGVREFVRSNG